jgi:hypothetical protein
LLSSALAAFWFVLEVLHTPPVQSVHYDSHVLKLFGGGAIVILLLFAAAIASPEHRGQDSSEEL